MSLARVNLLNIGLMLAALAVAMALPFETFLAAYAVLGPLHYLTQISWLHDRAYFMPKARDWRPLVLMSLLITVAYLLATSGPRFQHLAPWAVSFLFFAFALAFLLQVTQSPARRALGSVGLVLLAAWLHGSPTEQLLFALYLPTVIHVFVFTGAFVLYGALKHRSATAYASLAVFVACAATALYVDPGRLGYRASTYAQQAYLPFGPLHLSLLHHVGLAGHVASSVAPDAPMFPFASWDQFFTTPASLQVGRFIAFAYTYHYLNWFSKTSVIRWHEVSKLRLALLVAAWLASLALYAVDYGVGIRWLLFLSFLHVVLEFPLDHKTFLAIGGSLLRRTRA